MRANYIYIYCHDLGECAWLIDGFWIGWLDLMIGFIDTLYTVLWTTGNCSAMASHNLEFTAANTPRFSVFTSCILASDLNAVVIPVSHMKSLHRLIPFLPLFCWLANSEDSTQFWFHGSLVHILAGWRLETQQTLNVAVWDPRYIALGRTHRKHRFLYYCMFIHCCRVVYTAQFRNNVRCADPQRTPLATPLLLLCDDTAYVLTQSLHCNGCTRHISWHFIYCCVRALPSNGCFCASTVLALCKYATISFLHFLRSNESMETVSR
jgi:hypothetical protein